LESGLSPALSSATVPVTSRVLTPALEWMSGQYLSHLSICTRRSVKELISLAKKK